MRQGLPRELAKIVNRCLAKALRALKNDLASGEIEPISRSGVRSRALRVMAGAGTQVVTQSPP